MPLFLIYNFVIMFKKICVSPVCILKIFKMLVKILNCSILIYVGSCYVLYIFHLIAQPM